MSLEEQTELPGSLGLYHGIPEHYCPHILLVQLGFRRRAQSPPLHGGGHSPHLSAQRGQSPHPSRGRKSSL